jgi:hypothetical protein
MVRLRQGAELLSSKLGLKYAMRGASSCNKGVIKNPIVLN